MSIIISALCLSVVFRGKAEFTATKEWIHDKLKFRQVQFLQGKTIEKPSLWNVFYRWNIAKNQTSFPRVMGISVTCAGGGGGVRWSWREQRNRTLSKTALKHLEKKQPTSAFLVSTHLRRPGIKPRTSHYRTHHCGCFNTPALMVSVWPSLNCLH